MKILDRYSRLSIWSKISVWGVIATFITGILGFVYWLIPSPFNGLTLPSLRAPIIEIESITMSSRGPLGGYDFFDDDEIVANVSGKLKPPRVNNNVSIVAFWRLADGYVTNWHIGQRRVGSQYRIAVLDSAILNTSEWNFLVGGIECSKTYESDIALVLMVFTNSKIQENSTSWLDDNQGWGFESLPEGAIIVSPIRTFRVNRTR